MPSIKGTRGTDPEALSADVKTTGWALIRNKMLNKEHDASRFLSPMPLAISMH